MSKKTMLLLDKKATRNMPSPRFIRREFADKYFPEIAPRKRSYVFKLGMPIELSSAEVWALREQYGSTELTIVDNDGKELKISDELDTMKMQDIQKMAATYEISSIGVTKVELIKIIREAQLNGAIPLTQKEVEKRRNIKTTLKQIGSTIRTIEEKVAAFGEIKQDEKEEDDVYEKRIKKSEADIKNFKGSLKRFYESLNLHPVEYDEGFEWVKHGTHNLIGLMTNEVYEKLILEDEIPGIPRENLGYSIWLGAGKSFIDSYVLPGEYLIVQHNGRLAVFTPEQMFEAGKINEE